MSKRMAAGAMIVIIGLILLALIATDVYSFAFGRSNIDDKSYGTIDEGEFIDGELSFIMGRVGEVEAKEKIFGIPYKKTVASIYVIMDNGGYVLLQSSKDTGKLDSMTEDTQKYMEGEKQKSELKNYTFLAEAVEINDNQLELAGEFFNSKGMNDEYWMNQTCSNVLIVLDKTVLIAEICISCGLILIGIILIILGRRSTFGETVYVGEHPDTEESGAADEKETAEEESKE